MRIKEYIKENYDHSRIMTINEFFEFAVERVSSLPEDKRVELAKIYISSIADHRLTDTSTRDIVSLAKKNPESFAKNHMFYAIRYNYVFLNSKEFENITGIKQKFDPQNSLYTVHPISFLHESVAVTSNNIFRRTKRI